MTGNPARAVLHVFCKCDSFPVPLPGKRPKVTLRERLKVPSAKRLY
jgi:hypothetical protein